MMVIHVFLALLVGTPLVKQQPEVDFFPLEATQWATNLFGTVVSISWAMSLWLPWNHGNVRVPPPRNKAFLTGIINHHLSLHAPLIRLIILRVSGTVCPGRGKGWHWEGALTKSPTRPSDWGWRRHSYGEGGCGTWRVFFWCWIT